MAARRSLLSALCLALILLVAIPAAAYGANGTEPWSRATVLKTAPLPGTLDSEAIVQLTVDASTDYSWGGAQWTDGLIRNTTGSAVRSVILFEAWYDSSYQYQWLHYAGAYCWVLQPGETASFSIQKVWPAGAIGRDLIALAEDYSGARWQLGVAVKNSGYDAIDGERWYSVEVSNTTPTTLVGASVGGWEQTSGGIFLDAVYTAGTHPDTLAPGESFTVEVRGGNPAGGASATPVIYADGFPNPPRITVHRFFNVRTGTHFYTADESEKNSVINNLGWLYRYEGPGYNAYGFDTVGTTPLYRFYNVRTGTHFYTVDPDEAQSVIDNLYWLYQYEGPGFYVASLDGSWTHDAFRFYNRGNGVHFYTATQNERDAVMANLGWLYTYEGPAFSVPNP